jgi:hypothetical protein
MIKTHHKRLTITNRICNHLKSNQISTSRIEKAYGNLRVENHTLIDKSASSNVDKHWTNRLELLLKIHKENSSNVKTR